MAHEKSITVQDVDGSWVNIPTVVNGKPVSEEQAERLLHEGKLKPLGGKRFSSPDEAVEAAKQRSSGSMGSGAEARDIQFRDIVNAPPHEIDRLMRQKRRK